MQTSRPSSDYHRNLCSVRTIHPACLPAWTDNRMQQWYLRILKHISWSWNVSGPESTLSHKPRRRCNNTSTAESRTLPCKRYSWFGIILLLRAAVKLSIAVLTGWDMMTIHYNTKQTLCNSVNFFLQKCASCWLWQPLPHLFQDLQTIGEHITWTK